MRDIRVSGNGSGIEMSFVFKARGHPSILSSHPTTLEITTDTHLTTRGDCIVAVEAEHGLQDLPSRIKKALSTEKGRGRLTLRAGGLCFTVEGRGSAGLTFESSSDIVVRKSGFVSDRTLMVHSDRAAIDIPRKMVRLLQDPEEVLTVEISAGY